ncbi:hypothetical protein HMPREF9599_01091 [Cutibacterium acnes HL050PA2]|nr:hypothetical protein HMPREF9599_01091 [Cutibacterium acnes HL050PA2]
MAADFSAADLHILFMQEGISAQRGRGTHDGYPDPGFVGENIIL